jgi:hypothetical protein
MLIFIQNHASFAGLLIQKCLYVITKLLNLSFWLKKSIGIQFELLRTEQNFKKSKKYNYVLRKSEQQLSLF